MWEAQDLSGADKVNLMSAADRIPITGFTSNATTCTTKHLYIHKHISNLGSHHFSLLMQQILSVLSSNAVIKEGFAKKLWRECWMLKSWHWTALLTVICSLWYKWRRMRSCKSKKGSNSHALDLKAEKNSYSMNDMEQNGWIEFKLECSSNWICGLKYEWVDTNLEK